MRGNPVTRDRQRTRVTTGVAQLQAALEFELRVLADKGNRLQYLKEVELLDPCEIINRNGVLPFRVAALRFYIERSKVISDDAFLQQGSCANPRKHHRGPELPEFEAGDSFADEVSRGRASDPRQERPDRVCGSDGRRDGMPRQEGCGGVTAGGSQLPPLVSPNRLAIHAREHVRYIPVLDPTQPRALGETLDVRDGSRCGGVGREAQEDLLAARETTDMEQVLQRRRREHSRPLAIMHNSM